MSSAGLGEYLATDDLTVLLGLIAATLFLVQNLYKPQPLVHPILLGRQSDTARVRKPGESAVYRNYGTGLMGRFPIRPDKDIHILSDLVKSESDAVRTLWKTRLTNRELQDRVAAFGAGILRLANLTPTHSNALLLLNDSLEFLICDLALASRSIVSVTVTQGHILGPVLEAHPPNAIITHAELLPQILELIYDSDDNDEHVIIIVGEPAPRVMATVVSTVKVLQFEEVIRQGMKDINNTLTPPPQPSEIFTVSFSENSNNQPSGVQLTHENITSGIVAIRALLPSSNGMTSLDTIVSGHTLSSVYGRSIAYAALYEGCSFATLDQSKVFREEGLVSKSFNNDLPLQDLESLTQYPIPPATLLFSSPPMLVAITNAIEAEARKSGLLYKLARRHKLSGIVEGFVSRDSVWDRMVFDDARLKVLKNCSVTLRAVVVSGGPLPRAVLSPAKVALSIPVVNVFSHNLVCGPVLASHPFDLQDFPQSSQSSAHVGPPSVNIEVKLLGVSDKDVEEGGDPTGTLLVRGPSVGKVYVAEEYVSIPPPDGEEEGWTSIDTKAMVMTNGAFHILY